MGKFRRNFSFYFRKDYNYLNERLKEVEGKLNDFEYQSLRGELLQLFNRQINSINLGLGGTLILIGFNLSKDYQFPLVFVSPVIILSLCIIQIIQDFYNVLHIAVYIQINIETNGKKWENWMSELRKKSLTRDPVTSIYAAIYFVWIAFITGFVCIVLSLIYGYQKHKQSILSVGSWNNPIDLNCLIFCSVVVMSFIWWLYISFIVIKKLNRNYLSSYEAENRTELKLWLEKQ